MIKRLLHHYRILACLFAVATAAIPLLSSPAPAFAADVGAGTDVELGGYGNGQGKFQFLRAIAFDGKNNLYVLDGSEYDRQAKQRLGNLLVQEFDSAGQFIRQFPIVEPKKQPGDGDPNADTPTFTNDPQRIAVDSQGNIYITQPRAESLQQYGPDGKLIQEIAIPQAMNVTVCTFDGSEAIAVLGSQRAVIPQKGWTWLGGEHIEIIDLSGKKVRTVDLGQHVVDAQEMACDSHGNFYVQAELNQIYEYDPTGTIVRIFGGGTKRRVDDGSELMHELAVDPDGNVYGMTFGNPGKVCRFNADGSTLTQRPGQFHFGDSWSYDDMRTPMAVDHQGRLWLAPTRQNKPNDAQSANHHFAPAVLRLTSDFFQPGLKGVTESSTLALGMKPVVQPTLPYAISYTLDPVTADFVIPAANLNVHQVTVNYHVYDMYKNPISDGQFDLPLKSGVEARHPLTFTPPKFGWYTIECSLTSDGHPLMAIGSYFGVTPKYANMPTLAQGDADGSWMDAARQVFVGLPLMRLSANTGIDRVEKDLAKAEKFGAQVFCQFVDKKDCTPENVRKFVTHFKGRIKVWEIMNEPNFTMSPEQYTAMVKELSPLIKSIDPQAKVMGPDVCGVDLNWYKTVYEKGIKPFIDILSIHDYDGHETFDDVHWRWKIGALRELAAKFGDGAKPIWQTERTTGGIRGGLFMGGAQAVRVTMHQDLMQTLGIPNNHDLVYYLNENGYHDVPTYLWSANGPHPGALALRTRAALIGDRPYRNMLDFGPVGNKLLLGLDYAGTDGATIVLRNLGLADQPLRLSVHGGSSVIVSDAFGNQQTLPIDAGHIQLTVPQMPIYLSLAPGQTVEPQRINYGPDLAHDATFTYSADSKHLDHLNDGIWQTTHAGNPNGGTDGSALFVGELPTLPQTLSINFRKPQKIGAVLIATLSGDNGFCTLLDYDLQYRKGEDWQTLQEVRTPVPPTDRVKTADSSASTWALDNNRSFVTFDPITTNALRLVIRRTTHGFAPDDAANQAVRDTWGGKGIDSKLMLREIEIYGPASH